jgi:hypothetical protein
LTDLLRIQRIAFFGKNVYMLYVAEMVHDSKFSAVDVYSEAAPKSDDYRF